MRWFWQKKKAITTPKGLSSAETTKLAIGIENAFLEKNAKVIVDNLNGLLIGYGEADLREYVSEVRQDVISNPLRHIGGWRQRWSYNQCFADILWGKWVLGTAKEDLESLLSEVSVLIETAEREPDKKYTIAPEGLKKWKIDSMRIEPMKVVFDESGNGKVYDIIYIGSREYSHWLEEIRSWQNFLRELGESLSDLFEFMIHAEKGLCKVEGGEQAKQSSISLTFGELDKK